MNTDSRICGNTLRLVPLPAGLPLPFDDAPTDWRDAAMGLLRWLGLPADPDKNAATTPDIHAPAPWRPVPSAAVFQDMHSAGWIASYLVEQGSGVMLPRSGIDVMLASPHPAGRDAAQIDHIMIRTARAEGRGRIAVIRADDAAGTCAPDDLPDGTIALSLTDAMRRLAAGAIPWDAIIVPAAYRQRVFARLAQASGVRGPWPMLVHGRSIAMIGAEGHGGGTTRTPDAHLLVHTLALALREAGRLLPARRLHDAWARLRDTGITTPGRGRAGPYASVMTDCELLAMICNGMAQSKREVPGWKALARCTATGGGSQTPPLRVVVSNGAVLP